MTHKTNHQRCYDSNLRFMQQAQWNQRNTQQIQASSQRCQDRFQASQKRLQEIYQSQRNLNCAYIGFTNAHDGYGYRFWAWCLIQSMGSVIIVPGTFLTLSMRVATKVVLPLLGFFSVTTAIGCYYYNRPSEPSLDEFGVIIMPKIEDKPKKLTTEGYYDSIRSLFSKVACCASWFISQEKPESKSKIQGKPEKLPAEGYYDSIRSFFSRVVCSFSVTSEKSKVKPIVQKNQDPPRPIQITLKFKETFFDIELLLTFGGKTNPTERRLQVEKQKQIIEEIIKIHEPDYTDSLGLMREMTDKGLIFEKGILPHGNKARDLWKKLL